ncbi:MAG TPA: NAD-dependent epimerase/dehydratase family protein [Solirubrobacteraceae bacterium]|nr:NAD-dependent epimerase/dehydratase family protein [Solirubrobacteraceae bacterium]
MAKTLLTGGTGLIGSHVARALLERGDDLRLTVRESSKTDNLDRLDCDTVRADIHDRRSLRRALKGVDRVFHVAGFTSLRAPAAQLYRVNVDGTRTVLEECLRAGVERVVYTSSVAAIGPAETGSTADETAVFAAGGYGIPYVNAKHEAEVAALRLAARGLPVVIVNPAHVFGRGDLYRSSTDIVRRFLMRRLPAYVDGGLNIVDVTDVAAGHLAADERGVVGERYILGNRNYTLARLFADLARVSGVEPPALKLPLPAALAMARAAEQLPGRPPITAIEVQAGALWWTYRSTKAKRELGWAPGHHEDTIEATVNWYREREGSRLADPGARQALPLRVAGFAARQAGALVERVVP